MRVLKTSIFIACEGKNTEPLYFEKIKEVVEGSTYAITVYPDKSDENPVSHALGLVREAQSRINDFDEVWVVFDKDGYAKHKETFELADKEMNGKKVNIAFSSIAFEQWVLLHFEKSVAAHAKSKDIIQYLKDQQYYPDYAKSNEKSTYTFLQNRTLQAIENAVWLRHYNGALTNTPVYDINPYTDIDKLVTKLCAIEERFIWANPGTSVTIDDLTLTVTTANNTISVAITNNTTRAIVYNKDNIDQHFSLLNPGPLVLDTTLLIQPNMTAALQLSCSTALPGNTFIAKVNKTACMINL